MAEPEDADWETVGQRMVRNEVSALAERWGWRREDVLRMAVRERRAYWYRVKLYAEREAAAAKRK